MSDDPSTRLSDSDGEYHTCDEDEDDDADDDKVPGDPRAASPSSSSSDDGRDWLDYHHSSDDEDEEELDVLGAAAPVVTVKKETRQLYTSKITGLDHQVQEILESCGQKRHPVTTSGSRQDEDTLEVAKLHTRQIVPMTGSKQGEDTLAVAGSQQRPCIPIPGSQPTETRLDEETLVVARPHSRQIVPTPGSQHNDDSLAIAPTHHRQVVPTYGNTLASAEGGYNALVQLNVNVTQQQFGDVTVENATNINQSFGGRQNISKTATFHEERKGAELSRSEIIMNRTLGHIEAWNQGMVKTAVLSQVLNKLENGATWLTIKGNPGEGKTTVGYMALEELHKHERQVFEVRTPEEFSEVILTCLRPVIMLDDVFGNLEFDHSKWSSWEPVVGPLLKEREHKSHERENKPPKKDVTIILVGRDYVLNAASADLGRLSAFLTSDKYVIYMDHSMQRETEEKSAIWESISRSSGVQLDQHTVDKILRIDVAHGFPHVCRLFVTLHKENKEIKAEEFFRKPLEFLNHSISNFFKDAQKLQLFKEIVKHGGKVSIQELRRLDPMYKAIQAAASMVGSYLRIEDDSYLFNHPSIYDSVAFNLCSRDPVFVIQQCHLAFIHERVRLQMVQNTPSAARPESHLVVYVDRSYSIALAERFSAEIMKQNFYYVLSHQAFTDGSFVRKVMSQVSVPLSILIHPNDQFMLSRYSQFLCLVPSSKSPELLKYLDNCSEIELSKNDEEAIFYGTCKHAALQVLTYLTKTRSSLDINIRFGVFVLLEETPLTVAAQTGDVEFMQHVLSLKPDLNVIGERGKTALHHLCRRGIVSVVTQMIDSGAFIDVEDVVDEKTPLCLACEHNQLEIVKLLIGRGALVDQITLNAACVGGNLEIVKIILEKQKIMNNKETLKIALRLACQHNHIENVQLIKERGARGDEETLNAACRGGNIHIVKLLFKTVTSVHDKTTLKCFLHSACRGGSVDVLKFLIHRVASINTSTDLLDLLDAACEWNNSLAVEWLLIKRDGGCQDVNKVLDGCGDTALHIAANRGFKECVELLLHQGATVNTKNVNGNTPLHIAVKRGSCIPGDVPVCRELIKHGADVNTQNIEGNTPLHIAVDPNVVGGGNAPVCEELIKLGADVNKQNIEGNTPLHVLSLSARDLIGPVPLADNFVSRVSIERVSQLVTVLLDAGPDVNIKNMQGKLALDGLDFYINWLGTHHPRDFSTGLY